MHFVTQNDKNTLPPWEQARYACQNGARWISLRTQFLSYADILPIARRTRAVCRSFQAKFIINNNVHLAKELNADGVHLKKTDIPVDHARNILGDSKIIGSNANSFEDVIALSKQGVDYVALGPTKFAHNNLREKIITTSQFLCIKKQCIDAKIRVPIIARGGISPEDLELFLHLGIDGISVSQNMVKEHSLQTASDFLFSLQH